MKSDQRRVRELLSETVTLLCKNGLSFKAKLRIEGVVGITLDDKEVFIVHINEFLENPSISEAGIMNKTEDRNSATDHVRNFGDEKLNSSTKDLEVDIESLKSNEFHSKPSQRLDSAHDGRNETEKLATGVNSVQNVSTSDAGQMYKQSTTVLRNKKSTLDFSNVNDKIGGDITIKTEVDLTDDDCTEFQDAMPLVENSTSDIEFIQPHNFISLNYTHSPRHTARKRQFQGRSYAGNFSKSINSIRHQHVSHFSKSNINQYGNFAFSGSLNSQQKVNNRCSGSESSGMEENFSTSQLRLDMDGCGAVSNDAATISAFMVSSADANCDDVQRNSDLYRSLYSRARRSSAESTLKPYICPHAGCNLRFYHRNNVSRHCKLKHGRSGIQ